MPTKPWTKEEEEVLRREAEEQKSIQDVADLLGRTKRSVRAKATKLGISFKVRPTWTKEQEFFLESNYEEMSIKDIEAALPYTREGIFKKAQRMGLKYHTDSTKKKNEQQRAKRYYSTAKGKTRRRINAKKHRIDNPALHKEYRIKARYGTIESYHKAVARRVGKDNVVYDSSEEALVANVLYDSNLKYRRNRDKLHYDDGTALIPDFIVENKIYVEYFGLLRAYKEGSKAEFHKKYAKKVERKIAFFKERKIPFVAIYHDDLIGGTVLDKIEERLWS